MLLTVATTIAVSGCGGSGGSAPKPTADTSDGNAPSPAQSETAGCTPSRVHYTPYPGGGKGLSGLPWIRGVARSHGLVGLIWYAPPQWERREVAEARIYTDGKAPAESSTKILWTFLAETAGGRAGDELTVRGRRFDRPGSTRQRFAAISYSGQNGAPSYASVIDLPRPGCWRLYLSTGELHGTVDLRAIPG